MSYDNPMTLLHQFGEVIDFGDDADVVRYIKGPPGKKGMLKSVSIETMEAFACTTTPAAIEVGTAGDDDAYANLLIADLTADNVVFSELDDTDAIISPAMPADTLIKVTMTQSTDNSSDTGQGYVSIIIDWY